MASDVEQRESHLISISRDAMASTFEVNLNAGQYPHGTDVALKALDEIDRLEQRLSYFAPDSEVSLINRAAVDQEIAVDAELFDLLKFSRQLGRETSGAFDIACASLWKTWGFARHEGAVPSDEQLKAALTHTGMQHLKFDDEAGTVRWKTPGVELNLGAIGKGYAIDVCSSDMRRAGVNDFLMHGGQSSVAASGSQIGGRSLAGLPLGFGWSVGIAHPMRSGKRLGEIVLRNRALGTSGSGRQFFRHEGRRYSHIIDPRSGRPAEGVYSATVVAPTAIEADALSTAFFVLGPEFALDYCQTRPELSMVIVAQSDAAPGYKILDTGFKEGEFLRHEDW